MTARARWFTDNLPPVGEGPAPDPDFDEPAQRIEDVGDPVDVTDPEQLTRTLDAMVKAEGRMFNEGVTCSIKDRDDTCCVACPLRPTRTGRLANLCTIGVEQEKAATGLAIARDGG